ncbi:MAG: hypothetical protein JWL70_3074 [Acidimicrobiia bacterium]|nr:hypothetical protein [Acidimicrobiia bacterium]
MSEPIDPFEVLRRPIAPVSPRAEFAAALRHRLIEELPMYNASNSGALHLVHLAVGDADQAMRFFGSLFGWEGERYAPDHVSYYTLNTEVTVRFVDDPAAAPVRPNYAVANVGAAVRAIEAAGGQVTDSALDDEGGGWAFATDREGLPLLVFRPGDRRHPSSSAPVTGDVAIVFINEDAQAAIEFYGAVLGWTIVPDHPGGSFYAPAEHVALFDVNAATGTAHPPAMTLYLGVPALEPAMARIVQLGGTTEAVPTVATMGPFFNVLCTDDQGTRFGLIAGSLTENEEQQ